MRNVHISPTEKPSRLVKFFTNKFHLCKEILPIQDEEQYQNIYITNDEEIKEGDYIKCAGKIGKVVKILKKDKYPYLVEDGFRLSRSESEKITLTTDQSLDGVQAIDDEFLEWFVKNPSCEFVEVGYGWIRLTETDNEGYWVSIPDKQFEMQQQINNSKQFYMEKKRNLWVIPTDKPSRLKRKNDEFDYSPAMMFIEEKNWKNQYIYITNDEEIKEDYVIVYGVVIKVMMLDEKTLYFVNGTKAKREDCKKIILTTDPDLIAEGVQPIDNEFLEWFVKNPSCEFVEVVKEGYKKNGMIDEATSYRYKIIIPNLEIWKDIPEFEGYYQVSNLGNVKSLSRTILGKNDVPTLLKEKMLKFSTSTNGYYQVILCKNSDRKIFKVHSLVAICFLNHIPDGTHNVVIDHINEIKTDNRIENLRLIGHRENVSRSIKDSTSTYVGVSWSKNAKKWISQITIDGKTKYLGLFDNEQDANKKYLETLKDL
jgi:hypothetical protein